MTDRKLGKNQVTALVAVRDGRDGPQHDRLFVRPNSQARVYESLVRRGLLSCHFENARYDSYRLTDAGIAALATLSSQE